MWTTPRTVPSMGDVARPGARRWTYTTPRLATARRATLALRRALRAVALSYYGWLTCSALVAAAFVFAAATRRATLDAALLPLALIGAGLWGYWLKDRL